MGRSSFSIPQKELREIVSGYGANCPSTGKVQFRSRRDARRVEKRSRAQKGRMRAYACDCGWWHLGHLPRAVVRGARQLES